MENIYVTKAFLPPYEEFIEKIKPLWSSAKITNMGRYHNELESELKKYLSAEGLSLFTNGHMALEMVIQAFRLEGEVITTPYTFVSTTHAIVRNNLKPVFCDINEKDYTIDVSKIEDLITEKTAAIVPVHVYGHVCDYKEIDRIARRHNLKVIYDAAHAFGVRINGKSAVNFGDASILSFHATKVFNTVEGGAVIYSDPEIGRELYRLRNFGIKNEVIIDGIGANAKMDEFRAAMGLCSLKYIRQITSQRRDRYTRYMENLEGRDGIRLPSLPHNIEYNYAYFPVCFDAEILGAKIRDGIYDYLKENGIYARRYFYPLISEADCYRDQYRSKDTPVARKVSESILTLPLYPDLPLEEVDRICDLIIKFINQN